MREKVHIVGIGGVGMSAIAQALLDKGIAVSGSDRLLDIGDTTPVLESLRAQGVALFPQDGSGVDNTKERVVVSTAIEEDNPDLRRASSFNIPVEHRSLALRRIVAGHELIAITGTSGKSSVTAMLGFILEGCGFDPLVVNGAAIIGWAANGSRIGSVRKGAGPAVIEADESDRSLLTFTPRHAVITNASADHFGMDETLRLFDDFRQRVTGKIIDGLNDDFAESEIQLNGLGSSFVHEGQVYNVPVPGAYNARNARHAVRMALALGATPERVAQSLAAYKGVERRLQIIGERDGAVVIDDYAHNPEKITAAWNTLAQAFPGGVCGIWRPHGYTPLRKMMDDLVEMFAKIVRVNDKLLLLPVYDVGGTATRDVSSEDLAFKLHQKGVKVELIENLERAELQMRNSATDFGVLLCFGARDPGLPKLAARLTQ